MATQAELVAPDQTRLWFAQNRWLGELKTLARLCERRGALEVGTREWYEAQSHVARYQWQLADRAARFECAAEQGKQAVT